MINPIEEPKPNPVNDKKGDNIINMSYYKTRLKEAVVDAQFMMDYAATNTKSIIDPVTLKRLITARQLIENDEKLTPDQETEFWLAYQDLWELVSPATAESIKANQLIEETLVSRLVKYIPGLSRWLGKGTTSKARRTVNGYILFTIIVLFLLLSFQIYWVVGNQLVQEMGVISQREEFLNSQIAALTSTSSVDADAEATKAGLEADLKTIDAKEERYAAILWLWSKPWNGYIEVVRKEHDPKFAPRFIELERQIAEIENKQREDPDGSNEARANAQQEDLQTRLKEAQNNVPRDEDEIANLENQINNISNINILEAELLELTTGFQSDQSLRDVLALEKQESENLIITLTADRNTIQESMRSINAELEPLLQTITDYTNMRTNIGEILARYENISLTPDSQKISTEEMAELPEELKVELQNKPDLAEQLIFLRELQSSIDLQLDYLETKQRGYGNQQIQNDVSINNIQFQIDNLNDQVIGLETDIANLDASLETKQSQIDEKTETITSLKASIKEFQGVIDAEKKKEIVDKRAADLENLKIDLYFLSLEEQEYLDRTDSRPAQLAGQFVLNILQSYFLPILYGLLGASTSVLRSLSRQIRDVMFSEKTGIQHLLSVSLGALAGIVVGWFSFLIDPGTTSFLGSVSPLAIAFLVGFNIDPFFSRMDLIMKSNNEASRTTAPTPKVETKPEVTPPTPKPSNEKTTTRAAVPDRDVDTPI